MAGDCVRASDVVLHVGKLGQTRSPARLPPQPANGQPWPHTIAFCYAQLLHEQGLGPTNVWPLPPRPVKLGVESIITAHNGGNGLPALCLCLYEAVCRMAFKNSHHGIAGAFPEPTVHMNYVIPQTVHAQNYEAQQMSETEKQIKPQIVTYEEKKSDNKRQVKLTDCELLQAYISEGFFAGDILAFMCQEAVDADSTS
jgi:hypothetical protein